MRVAINGFGRIGRLFCRMAQENKDWDLVAINDLSPADNLAYLLKYDTTHGTFPFEVKPVDQGIEVNGNKIVTLSEANPENLPWKALGVDIVIECTGIFCKKADASKHLAAGAKQVIISAPAKDDAPTYVMGVNHEMFSPGKDTVISNASCTTNCLAPVVKVLLDSFGIEEGLMTTVHAITATQPTVDGASKKDFRGGRGAGYNIIPSSTGAAKAVALCLPEIKGKLTGMAFRVPTIDVSAVDLTVRLTKGVSFEKLCETFKRASETTMKGILGYCDEPLVSSDFIGDRRSAIFDKGASIALNDNFFKLVAWYDNEMGYAARLIDLVSYVVQSLKNQNVKNGEPAPSAL